MDAMGLPSMNRRMAISPENIFSICHGFQVLGVHAMADSAQVVEGKAYRYLPN